MRHRLLVVEDETPVRAVIVSRFREDGYEVDEAENGSNGLEMCRAQKFDGVLLDVILPDEDGIEMVSAIKRICPDLPVIIMTGLGTDERLIQRAKQNGATAFVSKGAPMAEFAQTVARYVKSAPSSDQPG